MPHSGLLECGPAQPQLVLIISLTLATKIQTLPISEYNFIKMSNVNLVKPLLIVLAAYQPTAHRTVTPQGGRCSTVLQSTGEPVYYLCTLDILL